MSDHKLISACGLVSADTSVEHRAGGVRHKQNPKDFAVPRKRSFRWKRGNWGGTCKVPAVPMGKLYHLSRLAAPKAWPIKRKGVKWVARPIAGPHNLGQAMPLVVWLKEILALATTSKSIRIILNAGEIKINSKVTKELNFPVGIFDIISIEKLNKHYRVLVDQNGKLRLLEIPKSESKIIPLKVTNKKTIKGGKQQIGFNNGWAIFADKNFSVSDCVLFDVELRRVKSHFKPAAGHTAYILSGEHANQTAELKSVKLEGVLRKKKLAVLSNDTETFETSLDKIFILGKEAPEIKLK